MSKWRFTLRFPSQNVMSSWWWPLPRRGAPQWGLHNFINSCLRGEWKHYLNQSTGVIFWGPPNTPNSTVSFTPPLVRVPFKGRILHSFADLSWNFQVIWGWGFPLLNHHSFCLFCHEKWHPDSCTKNIPQQTFEVLHLTSCEDEWKKVTEIGQLF